MAGEVFALLAIMAGVQYVSAGYYGPLETKQGLSDSAKQYILCEHNRIRAEIAKGQLKCGIAQPTAANMQCMCWCDELVPKAQAHADNCGGPSHDSRSARGTENFKDVGQSLMDTMKSAPIEEAMDAFSEECSGYTFDTNSCDPSKAGRAGVCGHYTALAWAKSQCIGCAYNECEGHPNGRLVCNYGPGGNIQGEKPYEAGAPCSRCNEGQKCVDGGLCCGCSDLTCGNQVASAQSSSDSCSDAIGSSTCGEYDRIIHVCSASAGYYLWGCKNCQKTCGACGGVSANKVCNKNFNVSNDFCKVHKPDSSVTCMTGNGLFYTGTQSKTENNHDCLQWSAQAKYHDFEFPERRREDSKNYCRNPGASGSRPWCYVSTQQDSKGWDYCNIPSC